MALARLAALHGVATSYSPSAGVTVEVPDDTVVAVLAALGVDASTPRPARRARRAESAAGRAACCPRRWSLWTARTARLPIRRPRLATSRPAPTLRRRDRAGRVAWRPPRRAPPRR